MAITQLRGHQVQPFFEIEQNKIWGRENEMRWDEISKQRKGGNLYGGLVSEVEKHGEEHKKH